jgi:hypothetical protein
MYKVMEPLKHNKLESIMWLGHLRFMSLLFFFAYFPKVCGMPLTASDVFGIGFGIPYLYFCYLVYKEHKNA